VISTEICAFPHKEYGIDETRWKDLLPMMAQQALASGSPGNNPRIPSVDEIQDLYREAWA
jgi:alcohol dehydrogenase class IV